MQIRITGGRLVDPGHFVGIADILIEDEKIVAMIEGGQTGKQDQASNIQRPGDRIFDASGKIVNPGAYPCPKLEKSNRIYYHDRKNVAYPGCR